MKPSKQQPKRNLHEVVQDRLKTLADARIEKIQLEKRSKYKQQEDDTMAQCYGPNWRTRYPGEPEAPKKVVATEEVESVENDYSEYDEEDDEDDLRRVRKAS